jgi:hypothetical protein
MPLDETRNCRLHLVELLALSILRRQVEHKVTMHDV